MTTEKKNLILMMKRAGNSQRTMVTMTGLPKSTIQKFLAKNKDFIGYRVCPVYGEEFPISQRMGRRVYCSFKCYKKANNAEYTRVKTLKHVCECCGKEFMTYSCQKDKRFCSLDCKHRFMDNSK